MKFIKPILVITVLLGHMSAQAMERGCVKIYPAAGNQSRCGSTSAKYENICPTGASCVNIDPGKTWSGFSEGSSAICKCLDNNGNVTDPVAPLNDK